MNKKSVIVASFGFLLVGFLAWMHGLSLTGWVQSGSDAAPTAPMMLSVLLAIAGILAFFHEEVVDSLVFLAFAALVVPHASGQAGMESMGALGWDRIIWAVFFLALWWSSRSAGGIKSLFLLALWLALAADATKYWSGTRLFTLIEGYLVLISGLLALATSAKALCRCNESGAGAGSA